MGPPSSDGIYIKVKLDTLTGFLIGPESHTFQAIKKENEEVAHDLDEWKYVSLCDRKHVTYDFKVSVREECLDFIIATSQAAIDISEKFFGLTNRKLLKSYFTRSKLRKVAARRKLTVHQMIMVACYDSVTQLFPEETFSDKK